MAPITAILHDQSPDPDERRILVNGRPVPYWQQVRWVQAIPPVHLPAAAVPVGLGADAFACTYSP